MKRYLPFSLALLIACTSFGSVAAQQTGVEPPFGYLRDYTFEKIVATKEVHDSHDDGRIHLVSYVYRPVHNDRHEVVLMSHGSTGGEKYAPSEPIPAPRELVSFFLKRGYTFVFVNRRGAGESTGTYVEECPGFAGKCTASETSDMFDASLASAIDDTLTVIQQVIYGKLVAPGSQLILVGQSRGGFLSLAFAGEHPEMVKAVVNFVGGWNSITDANSAAENAKRSKLAETALARVANRYRGPTLWVYGARDPNYSENVTREWFKSFKDGGGCGTYLFAENHKLPSGHMIISLPTFWTNSLDQLLKSPGSACAER